MPMCSVPCKRSTPGRKQEGDHEEERLQLILILWPVDTVTASSRLSGTAPANLSHNQLCRKQLKL